MVQTRAVNSLIVYITVSDLSSNANFVNQDGEKRAEGGEATVENLLRSEMLLGREAMARLATSHVAVFGIGGVGSFAAEALARGGVGEMTLVDHDVVSESNLT